MLISFNAEPQQPQQKIWQPAGEFSSIKSCQKAAHELGHLNGKFKCVNK
jgi:hypothetical protein